MQAGGQIMQKKIMCYGDSNTYGYVPAGEGARYEKNKRWCGILAELLGDEYLLIEAGHNGRTTDQDVPFDPERNGLACVSAQLKENQPLDLVIVMLGTNDTKEEFGRDEKRIGQGLKALVEKIQKELESMQGHQPQILIISPANVREDAEYGPFGHEFSARSYKVSQKLAEEFRTIAEETGSMFFNAAEFIETSPLDGIHLSEESHHVLAHNLFAFLKEQNI